jgi:hypothetical protein
VLKLKVTTIRRKKVMHWTRPRRARVRA